MNIAVFISGKGSNLKALINAQIKREISKGKITLVVSNNSKALGLEIAKKANIETFVLEKKDFKNKKEYESNIIKKLEERNIEVIVLAGFMQILSGFFIEKYKNKILNIHPSLLPAFKGAQAIKDAFNYGVKVTGVTVHFVTEKIDYGPIIDQQIVEIEEKDTLESLEKKIHEKEHIMYKKALDLFVREKIKIQGRKVIILK